MLVANAVFYSVSRYLHELHHKALQDGSYNFDVDDSIVLRQAKFRFDIEPDVAIEGIQKLLQVFLYGLAFICSLLLTGEEHGIFGAMVMSKVYV